MVDILIYGSGAIGSFLGYLLSDIPTAGKKVENVGLLGRKGHIDKIKQSGLEIIHPDGKDLAHFQNCFSSLQSFAASSFSPEIVIVCVKSYSLPSLCQELTGSGLLKSRFKDCIFLLLMNGMGNRDCCAPLDLPAHRLFEGITSMGVKHSGDGKIELKGRGKTVIEGRLDAWIKRFLQQQFSQKGFEIEFAEDFAMQQWNKLFVNAVINPITALTRQQNSVVLSSVLKETASCIIREAVSVAVQEGIAVDEGYITDMVNLVADRTAANTSSMLQDVLRGRMTEIDSINGYIVSRAKKHSLNVPVNEALIALVKSTRP